MKSAISAICIVIALRAFTSFGESLHISTFTDGFVGAEPCEPGTLYRVEWSSTLSQPSWSSASPFLPIESTSTIVQAAVPMFYRVAEMRYTNSIYGTLYYGETPVTNHPICLAPGDALPGETNRYYSTLITGPFGEFMFSNIVSGIYSLIVDERIGNTMGRRDKVILLDADIHVDVYVMKDLVLGTGWPQPSDAVTTNQPTIKWDSVSVPGIKYSISLYDDQWNQINWTIARVPQHRFPDILEHGHTYIWEVEALLDAPEYFWFPWKVPYRLFRYTCWGGFTVNIE
jgi:hypothetical protein